MGYFDGEFWIGFFLISLPAFAGGWIARSWVQAEKERLLDQQISRARRLHPSSQPPAHLRIIDDG